MFAHLGLDGVRDLAMLAEELLRVLPPLADALAVVAEPCAGLFHNTGLHAKVQKFANLADALAIHDVELDLPERRGQLVLHHLDAGLVADDLLTLLDLADAADLHPDRGIELQRVAAICRIRIAKHDADFHADLVEEDQHALAAADAAGDLAQRLA